MLQKSNYILSLDISGDTNIVTYLRVYTYRVLQLHSIFGVYTMKCIEFSDYANEKVFINISEDTIIYLKLSTDFVAVATVDNEDTYRIEILNGAYDNATLKHFVEFLKARGLQPEKYIA